MVRQRRSTRVARNGFREITESLRASIEAGHIVSGAYLPTERELQEDFGSSRATVRKALAALVESGWAFNVPNRGVVASRGLRPGLSSYVAFIHIQNFSLTGFSNRLSELFEERGLQLVHLPGSGNQTMESLLRVASESNFAGALVWSYRGFPDPEAMRLAAGHLPVVDLDHRSASTETDLVTFEHEEAAYQATDRLIKSGCKRIGVTGMLDMLEITHQRFRGYMRAMFANDLQPLPTDFVFCHTSGLPRPDTCLLQQRLESGAYPDGLLVLQDFLVPAVAEAVGKAGLSPSTDIQLATIGVDLEPEVKELTTVAVALDWVSLADQAVEVLSERLSNLHSPPQVRFAPYSVHVKQRSRS